MEPARRAEADLAALEARMAAGDHGDEVMGAYEEAQARLERAGGYAWRAWMERVLRGLGIGEEELPRPLVGFSGGELTRASLARSLVSRPDVLLLDEPTNHLDIEAVEWLERTIVELDAAVVLVSHDRWFLESVATAVLEIDRGRSKHWPMGYSAFRRERALAIDRQGAEAEQQAKEIARLERFVTRWRAGTKARQAASRQKQLDRIVRVETPRRQSHLAFGFPKAERSGRVVVEVDGLDVEVPGRRLIAGAGFTLERGQRLAIVAPNGAGKTTLLETLIGERPPARGRVTVGHRVSPAYFSQHGEDLRRRPDRRRDGAGRQRPDPDAGPHAARRLPLLRRGGRRAGGPPVGRRAPAAVAGLADREGRQPAGARRADEPPGHREPRGARGGPRGLRRHRSCSCRTTAP